MPSVIHVTNQGKGKPMDAKKIGILGSGAVAQTLANGFMKHGSEVMLGSRDQKKLADWKKQAGAKGRLGTLPETAAWAQIVVLAVKGSAALEALRAAGAENISGKTVIDVTNPIADASPVNGVIAFFTSLDRSLMEQLQKEFPKAHFVKAFNSIGNAFMVNPDFGGTKPSMFICGNDANAKKDVSAIVETFGFEAEDMGMAEGARAIEPLCMLWCIPGMLRNEWSHAFKLLKTR